MLEFVCRTGSCSVLSDKAYIAINADCVIRIFQALDENTRSCKSNQYMSGSKFKDSNLDL